MASLPDSQQVIEAAHANGNGAISQPEETNGIYDNLEESQIAPPAAPTSDPIPRPAQQDCQNGKQAQENSSEEGKLFLGGLSWDTTEEKLKEHFSKYGQIQDVVVMREPVTGRSRGFGFVQFTDISLADIALQDEHILDSKTIDAKKAVPKGAPKTTEKICKIFVGGIPPQITELDITSCFSKFGQVVHVNLMIDKETGRSRGFAFVTFEDPSAVQIVFSQPQVILGDKAVDIKTAKPRTQNQNQMGYGGPNVPYYPRPGAYPVRGVGRYSYPGPAGNVGYNRYPGYGGAPGTGQGSQYRQYNNATKYSAPAAPRPDQYAGYAYGSYGYPYHQPTAGAAPTASYGRYPPQAQRPAYNGYSGNTATPQTYGTYNHTAQQPAAAVGIPQADPYAQAATTYASSARARYPSRPQQPHPNMGYHPYQR